MRKLSSFFTKRRVESSSESSSMPSREATHAGSWYSGSRVSLTRQLDQWLAQVPDGIEGLGSFPISGARFVIAPYVLLSKKKKKKKSEMARIYPNLIDMRVMHIQGHVRPMLTKRWICPKREWIFCVFSLLQINFNPFNMRTGNAFLFLGLHIITPSRHSPCLSLPHTPLRFLMSPFRLTKN